MSFKRVGSFLLLAVTFLLLAIADARKGSFERQGNTEDFDVQSAKQTVLDTVLDKTKQELDGHNSAWTDKPTGDSSGNDSGDDSDKASPWQGNIKQALQGIGKHFKPDQDSQGNKPDYPADKEGTSEFPWGNKPQKSGPQQDDASQQPHAGADTGAASSGGDNVSDAVLKGVLDLHNQYRARHGAPALSWSSSIASTAQATSRGCMMQHSGNGYGENLAKGHSSFDAAVKDWYSEVSSYSYGSGGGSGTGHFTQIVWKGTTSLGCGYSACDGFPLYVCNYSPPANVAGQYSANVLPPAN